MKIIAKAIIPFLSFVLISCNSFTSTPTTSPASAMETVISIAFTQVVKTQTAMPFATLPPTPAPVFPIISRDNVSQISEVSRWQTNPAIKVIWNESSTEVFMPELFDVVNVFDVSSFQSRQISLNEYRQLDPLLFTDETAEEGSCSRFWVRQTNIISPDKTVLVTGWSYGHKQPQKTVINLWDLVENKCILQLPEYDGALTALTFSSSGKYLIFSTDRATYVWSIEQSKITCQVNYAWGAAVYPAEKDVIVLTDGWGESGELSGLWDIEHCERIQKYIFGVSNPVFSPNGELLAGTSDNRILITDARTKEVLEELEIQPNQSLDLYFSPDGRFLLLLDYGQVGTANNKNTFILWAVQP